MAVGRFALAVVLVAALPVRASAENVPYPDPCIVAQLEGRASYKAAKKASTRSKFEALVPFMKLRIGDTVEVAPHTLLRLVFFLSGRQETWTGPAKLTILGDETKLLNGTGPVITMFDAGSTANLRRIPAIVREATGRLAGGTSLRGGGRKAEAGLSAEELAELDEAKRQYQASRKKLPPGDITPELIYLSILRDFAAWSEMSLLMDVAQKQSPKSAELKAIRVWLESKKDPSQKP